MSVYYSDSDPFVCEWTENLIRDGALPEGIVDGRKIEEVEARDLDGHVWCSFFNGLGGWVEAARIAGFSATRSVWFASLPCQPYSAAGRQEAEEDPRDLWPCFYRLVRECRPATILGEQVDAAIGLDWLDRVFLDMEAEGYACRGRQSCARGRRRRRATQATATRWSHGGHGRRRTRTFDAPPTGSRLVVRGICQSQRNCPRGPRRSRATATTD